MKNGTVGKIYINKKKKKTLILLFTGDSAFVQGSEDFLKLEPSP